MAYIDISKLDKLSSKNIDSVIAVNGNGDVIKASLNGFVTEDEFDKVVNDLVVGKVDLSDYYTKEEVNDLIDNADIDLDGYATEQWVENNFATDADVNDEIGKLESSLQAQINTKQPKGDYLTSIPSEYVTESELKTINGNSLIGSGDITITGSGDVDLSDYYTKEEINNNYQPKGDYLTSIPSEYVTETELAGKGYLTTIPSEYVTETELAGKGYLTTIPSEYITETELNEKGYLTSVPSEYVTESELNERGYATKSEIPTVPTKTSELTNDSGFLTSIPTDYVTESELNEKGYLTTIPTEYITETELNEKGYLTSVPSEYVTESELNDKGYITDSALSGYATETYVNNQIGDINTILEQIIG